MIRRPARTLTRHPPVGRSDLLGACPRGPSLSCPPSRLAGCHPTDSQEGMTDDHDATRVTARCRYPSRCACRCRAQRHRRGARGGVLPDHSGGLPRLLEWLRVRRGRSRRVSKAPAATAPGSPAFCTPKASAWSRSTGPTVRAAAGAESPIRSTPRAARRPRDAPARPRPGTETWKPCGSCGLPGPRPQGPHPGAQPDAPLISTAPERAGRLSHLHAPAPGPPSPIGPGHHRRHDRHQAPLRRLARRARPRGEAAELDPSVRSSPPPPPPLAAPRRRPRLRSGAARRRRRNPARLRNEATFARLSAPHPSRDQRQTEPSPPQPRRPPTGELSPRASLITRMSNDPDTRRYIGIAAWSGDI